MEHINDIKLLDYVGGRLDVVETDQIRRHISDCSACASRYRQVLATWDTLGEWRVDSAAHSVAERIEALAARSEFQKLPQRWLRMPLKSSLFAALRTAAAILIAIVGGHLLGRFGAASNEQSAVISTGKPQYLAALDFEWSSDLTWTVLEEDTPSGANRQ